ncbi:MAG TPA: pyruvate kinase [Blastocatellia bacterium]|nr:pyruvate kinase [Blastocatellia bacterium]
MRRTKIVCTLGPATSTREQLDALIRNGMNVARFNFSHGAHEEHAERMSLLRSVAKERGEFIAIMQDLQGPKIRTGTLRDKQVTLKTGDRLVITTRNVLGDANVISTTYPDLPKDVAAGDRILLSDGLIELRVESATPPDVVCTIINGGILGEHKGINLPGVKVSAPSLTEKDKRDLGFGIKQDVDYVALSFVRSAEDICALRQILDQAGSRIKIIAKLEKPEAIDNLEAILNISDAVMVARGDLGVELSPERVPVIQKHIINRANQTGTIVITATQMLESMINNPRPTRAEASDVANAILDGTDAVMLSGETSVGAYPAQAVRMMADIAVDVEKSAIYRNFCNTEIMPSVPDFARTISRAVRQTADSLNAKAIMAFTRSGRTARLMSKYRPVAPIIALSTNESVCRQMALFWGVNPTCVREVDNTDDLVNETEAKARETGLVESNDVIIVTASAPVASIGETNIMKLHRVK